MEIFASLNIGPLSEVLKRSSELNIANEALKLLESQAYDGETGQMDFVIVQPEELGFNTRARLKVIDRKAIMMGYRLCPVAAVAGLSRGVKEGTTLIVSTEALVHCGVPCVFKVMNLGAGRELYPSIDLETGLIVFPDTKIVYVKPA